MVRHPGTGKYTRTRLFVLRLGYSRTSVRLLTWASSTQTRAELHETAFLRLGGTVRVIVLDTRRMARSCGFRPHHWVRHPGKERRGLDLGTKAPRDPYIPLGVPEECYTPVGDPKESP